MTKVVVVFAGNEQGGAATHLLTYLSALQDGGLSSEVLFLSFGEGVLWDSVHKMEPTAEVLTGGVRNQLRGLRERMRKLQDKVLWHAHGPRLNVLVYLAKRGTRAPFTSTIHSNPMNDFVGSRLKSVLFTRLNLFSLRRAKGLFLSSSAFADFFPGQPHFFVPNAISRPRAGSVADLGADFRTKLGIPIDAKVIGIAARFDPVKDISTLIRAFALLQSKVGIRGLHPSVHLVIAGDGEQRDELRQLVSELGVENLVHFPGFLGNVRPFYETLDVHVLPSRSEGTPYVLLEAGVYGTPNIGSDIPGIRNLIDDEKTGLLFPVGNAEALADALERILSDAELRNRLLNNFQTDVLPRFSPAGMLEAYSKGYLEMGWEVP